MTADPTASRCFGLNQGPSAWNAVTERQSSSASPPCGYRSSALATCQPRQVDVREALLRCGGVADVGALSALGVTARQLQYASASGHVLRVRRGCYAVPGADPVVMAEVAWRAPATCISAAARLGLPVMVNDGRPHLLFQRTRTFSGRHLRPPTSVVAHWADEPHEGVIAAIDHAHACVDRVGQLAIVDAAIHRQLIEYSDLAGLRHGGDSRRRWLARHADGSAESPIETIMRVAMKARGLDVRPQVAIAGLGRVDFLVAGRVIVEVDGRAYHFDSIAFAVDRKRDRIAAAQGYAVLRFTYAEVVHGAGDAAGEVAAVVARLSLGRVAK